LEFAAGINRRKIDEARGATRRVGSTPWYRTRTSRRV
jgi:hypothetical protein